MSYLNLSKALFKCLKVTVAVLLAALFLQTAVVYAGTSPSEEVVAIKPHYDSISSSIQENYTAMKACSAGLKSLCRPGEVIGSEATWLFLAALIGFVFLTTKRRV